MDESGDNEDWRESEGLVLITESLVITGRFTQIIGRNINSSSSKTNFSSNCYLAACHGLNVGR
ncbi:hypothetical protein J6590_025279 [Homalodisca vitripennis]|nr:hypothetical protein J6590_042000 [Homalodisca vitripennis]KAG8293181.1 hypothetical protein J6590_025279 [Homalodisca vitripennis]